MPFPVADQTEVLFTRQRHEADRMGLHWDYRIVVGDKAYSWATKKEMPEIGKSIILFEQPTHDREYALSKKVVIPKGNYGAGVTTLDYARKAKVSVDEGGDKFTLHVTSGAGPKRFLLKKLDSEKYGDKAWLFKPLEEQEMNKYLEKAAAIRSRKNRDDGMGLHSRPKKAAKPKLPGGKAIPLNFISKKKKATPRKKVLASKIATKRVKK